MRIGKLRNRIEVQRKSSTRDSDGGERVEWSTIATVWAAIEPGVNREYWGSEQMQAETGVRAMSIVEVVRKSVTTVDVAHPGVQGPPGSGGGGAVSSVNGRTGAVVLTSLAALPAEQGREVELYLKMPYTRRDHPLVAMVQQAFGWTDAEVDALFAEADAV
jgi:hypothetical protein